MNNSTAIIVFSKYPEIGKVKTRLVNNKFSEEDAKNLQVSMLLDTLLLLNSISISFQPVISFYPQDKKQQFINLLNSEKKFTKSFLKRIIYISQTKDTLGKRFEESFKKTFEIENVKNVIIIATDTPQISVEILTSAMSLLTENENKSVIGPSQNGGFYLFGLNKKNIILHTVFDDQDEFNDLINISNNNQLTPKLLPFLFDIDLSQDVYNLYSYLKPISIELEILPGQKNCYFPEFTFEFLKSYFGDDF